MKKLFENWRNFTKEEKFSDLNIPKGKWADIPTSIIKTDPNNDGIGDEFYDLINKSYANIGGHVDFKSASDLPGNHTNWTAVDVDSDPNADALRVSKKTPFGNKMTVGATDGSPEGKKAYIEKTADLLQTQGNYAEMSDAIAHVMITKFKVPYVEDPKAVQRILGKDKEIKWIGKRPDGKYPDYNGWYIRKLGNEEHIKIMLGLPNI